MTDGAEPTGGPAGDQHVEEPPGGEHAFLERLRARLPGPPAGQLWLGDDAAVLEDGLLVATDVLVEDVHFELRWSSPEDVGWKGLAVNCSDVAAMGGTPRAAVVGLVVPRGATGLAEAVMEGLAEAATELGCPIVGGDTTVGPALVLSVAVLGWAPPAGAVRRDGARPGDRVFVTGSLGLAASALRALRAGTPVEPTALRRLRRPAPRLEEGRTAAGAGATAMVDVSDGLARDVAHVGRRSGVGLRLEAGRIPRAPGATLEEALGGGDDYELVFCAPDAGGVEDAFRRRGLPPPTDVGAVIPGSGVVLADADGERPLPPLGFDHDLSGPPGGSVGGPP